MPEPQQGQEGGGAEWRVHVLIVEWLFERDITTYNGIYEVKFDDNLECIYFKSWEMEKQNGKA